MNIDTYLLYNSLWTFVIQAQLNVLDKRDFLNTSTFLLSTTKTPEAKFNHDDFLLKLRDEFEATEKMSTYLLAFVICDFDLKTKQTPTNNISVSVIASKDKIDQVTFALDTAVSVTDYYEKYFKLGYPLPKQDLIAIPDFGAGAVRRYSISNLLL